MRLTELDISRLNNWTRKGTDTGRRGRIIATAKAVAEATGKPLGVVAQEIVSFKQSRAERRIRQTLSRKGFNNKWGVE